eukprot:IDg19452t1
MSGAHADATAQHTVGERGGGEGGGSANDMRSAATSSAATSADGGKRERRSGIGADVRRVPVQSVPVQSSAATRGGACMGKQQWRARSMMVLEVTAISERDGVV